MGTTLEPGRIAGHQDSMEVAGLLHRFQCEFDEYTPGVEFLATQVNNHIADDLSVFVLAGPPYVGIAQLRFRHYLFTGKPVCYVEELYVVPERRGQGHGRMLMDTAMQAARAREATTIELGTAMSDTAARGLYESLGFTNLEKPGDSRTQMLYYECKL